MSASCHPACVVMCVSVAVTRRPSIFFTIINYLFRGHVVYLANWINTYIEERELCTIIVRSRM